MRLITATAGLRGIDSNQALTAAQARQIKAANFDFVLRYVRRDAASGTDLSKIELRALLDAGLLVGIVQHVKSEKSWIPNSALGYAYGSNACSALLALGLDIYAPLWCDLEGVDPAVPATEVMAFGNAWYDIVAPAADPGLYVGWHCGLSPAELYRLPFKRYWGALNLNTDEFPAVRGLQMKQHESTAAERQALTGISFDTNTVLVDKKGDSPVFIGA